MNPPANTEHTVTANCGRGIEAVRPIRDEIKSRVELLISELVPAPAPAPARSLP